MEGSSTGLTVARTSGYRESLAINYYYIFVEYNDESYTHSSKSEEDFMLITAEEMNRSADIRVYAVSPYNTP